MKVREKSVILKREKGKEDVDIPKPRKRWIVPKSGTLEFDVEDGASKAKIKSAFVKNLKTKTLNKTVLSKFMELVA